MVFILTPDKEYRQLPCPGVVTVGRGEHNEIVVSEKSVSTNHCRLTLETLPPTNKVQIWIEDLNSKNGTYAGENRFEIERVAGKRIIHVGDLIRVGYCNNHMQIVDQLPKAFQDLNLPEIQIVPKVAPPGAGTPAGTKAPVLPAVAALTQPGPLAGSVSASQSKGNFISSPAQSLVIPSFQSHGVDSVPVDRPVQFAGLDPILSADPSPAAQISIPMPSQPIQLPPVMEFPVVPAPEPLQPAPADPSAAAPEMWSAPAQFTNPLLLGMCLPQFKPFDHASKVSLVKYLDQLDQWRDLLIAARGAMTKDHPHQDHYNSVLRGGNHPKPKQRKNRFQSRYLQLAAPKEGAAEPGGGAAREALLAELVAESLVPGSETAFCFLESALQHLHDLLQHCLLGAQIAGSSGSSGSGSGTSASREMDFLVQNELLSLLQGAYSHIANLQRSPLVAAMHQYNLVKDNKCDIQAIVESCAASLQRAMSFMTRHEEVVTRQFPVAQYYEVLLNLFTHVIEDLYDCYTVVLTLSTEAEQAVITHTHAHKGSAQQRYSADMNLVSSYNAEVDDVRQVRYDADLLSLLERVREQESAVLSEKFKRIVRVVDIFTKGTLKAALFEWKAKAKSQRRTDIKRFDFSEKISGKAKRRHWLLWREVFARRRHMGKCLSRMTRTMSHNLEKVRRCYWEIWKRNSNLSPRWARASDSLAQLKLSVLQLQAQLQEQSDKDANIAALAAEKALNKELSATNNELRSNIQNLQLQLLELCNVTLAKRRDVVLHSLLDKEEAVARANKEVKLLKAEMDGLRRVVGDVHRARRPVEEEPESEEEPALGRYTEMKSPKPSPSKAEGRVAWPTPFKGAKIVRPGLMSRKEAVQIVLLEVRRLRESMLRLEKQRDELKAVAAEETRKRVEQVAASQQITYRLLDLERSGGALRELLKQRVGLNGYTDLVTSLESMGVGAHVLQQSAIHAVADPVAIAKLSKPTKKSKVTNREYENAVGEAFS